MTTFESNTQPGGSLFLQVIRGAIPDIDRSKDPRWSDIRRHAFPRKGLPKVVNDWREANLPKVLPQFGKLTVARAAQRIHGMPFLYGHLWLTVLRANGEVEDFGLASLRVVTTAGVTYLAADMAAGANDINLFKFHAFGTGVGAEAAGDTALGTEETTQYNPDNTRPTGTQVPSTNTYTTVATYTPDSGFPRAISEHGILTQAATGGGTLWDRSQFTAVSLASGDSIQATYVSTFPAGG